MQKMLKVHVLFEFDDQKTGDCKLTIKALTF